MRQNTKRHQVNAQWRRRVKDSVKAATKAAEGQHKNADQLIQKAYSELDKSARKNVYHANKVARIKSRLARLANTKPTAKQSAKKTTRGKNTKQK